jgi:hypothetical protein
MAASAFGLPGVFELLMIVTLGGGVGIPLGVPPAAPDPMMAKIAPEKCLYYTTWVGMADPDPASANETEKLLAEPEVVAFVAELESVITQIAEKTAARRGPGERALVEKIPMLAKILVTHPTTIYLESIGPMPGGLDARGAMVVGLGDELPQVQAFLAELRGQVPEQLARDVDVGGVSCVRVQPSANGPAFTIGFRDRYLIVAVGEKSFEGILERATTPPPAWLTQAAAAVPVPRPSTLSYVNLESLLALARNLG